MRSSDDSNSKNSMPVTEVSERYHLVTFRLEHQMYALPIEPIQQIIEMVTITPIPQVSGIIEGVINVRGAAIPVINLRQHLGLAKIPLQLHTPIILVNAAERLVGLIVDEVMDVLDCQASAVVRPQDILPEGLGETPLLSGLIRAEENVIMLLDADHLFHAGHVQALANVATNLTDEVFAGQVDQIEALQAPEKSLAERKAAAKSKRKSAAKKSPGSTANQLLESANAEGDKS